MEKLCINCKHCSSNNQNNFEYFKCLSSKNSKNVNLVDGTPLRIFNYCVAHRNSDDLGCTKYGKFFEEK